MLAFIFQSTVCIKKNFTLWNLNYLQAIVFIWQLWLLRINDPQKQKVLYTLELNNNVIIIPFVHDLVFLRIQSCQINTIACR